MEEGDVLLQLLLQRNKDEVKTKKEERDVCRVEWARARATQHEGRDGGLSAVGPKTGRKEGKGGKVGGWGGVWVWVWPTRIAVSLSHPFADL